MNFLWLIGYANHKNNAVSLLSLVLFVFKMHEWTCHLLHDLVQWRHLKEYKRYLLTEHILHHG